MSKWIGVGGVKFSGKDTFAQFFVDNGFTKINFADNLKYMLASSFVLPLEHFYNGELKEVPFPVPIVISDTILSKLNEWIAKTHQFELPDSFIGKELVSPRDIMQFVGTDMIRRTYNDYHVEATLKNMEQHKLLVCADIRFPNESEGMRNRADELGFKFTSVYVDRPGYKGDSHSSETSITSANMDVTVYNDTTVENLHKIARVFL